MNKISYLPLDSKLAKVKVGKIIIKKRSFDAESINSSLKRFDLVYVLSQMNFELLRSFTRFDWIFPGVKVIFHSKLNSITFPKIVLSSEDFFNVSDRRELISLSEDLFLQSRFYPDLNLHRLGKKIYSQWMINSIAQTAADTILVSRNAKGSVIGFITVKGNNGIFEPVLVKVSDKYQGKGVGRKLMYKFFNYALMQDPRCSLVVNAMLHNTQAVNFYHTFGLQAQDHQYIYHVYPKGFKKY